MGSKLIRDKSQSPVIVSGVRRNVSSELSKGAAKKPIRTEREGPWAKKTERQSSQTASVHRTSKAKASISLWYMHTIESGWTLRTLTQALVNDHSPSN